MVDIGDPAKAFDALNDEIDHLEANELLEVGHAAIALVIARTKSGVDVNGIKFKPYSEKYYQDKYFKGQSRAQLSTKASKAEKSARRALANAVTDREKDLADKAFNRHLKAQAVLSDFSSGKTVDLVLTGHMLGGMSPMVTGANEVTVSFASDHEAVKAASNNYGSRRGMPAREFLDVKLEQELAFIAEVASEAMADRVVKKIA